MCNSVHVTCVTCDATWLRPTMMWGGVGWGGVCNNVHVTCVTCDATLLRPTMMWGGVGWGGVVCVLTFM